ncbi:hypothetical protein HDU67_000577 [Dinochytrium kinnereticum]|nr:hypothetical protein HDU67_000577 [Dinochytrium kinnereticum]
MTEPFNVKAAWEHLYAYAFQASKVEYNRTDFLQLGRRTRSAHILYSILYDGAELHPILASQSGPWASASEILEFREGLNDLLQAMVHHLYWWIFPKFRSLYDMSQGFEGRGLVLSTGKYHFEMALHLLVSLRTTLNSTIPVEVWYAGSNDLDSVMLDMLRSIQGVKTFDIHDYFGDEARQLGGWAIKPFAMLASSFREVIFVDADVLFLQDPYKMLDRSKLYTKYGQMFFRDRTLGAITPRWFSSFVPFPSNYAKSGRYMTKRSLHEGESGVVVVDKSRSAVLHGLLAACKLNSKKERDENTYLHVHGDKETFWMAWEMTRSPWSFIPGYGGSIGYKNERGAVCGGLYHSDEHLKPLWWNSGVLMNKYSNKINYIDFEYVALDLTGEDIEWEWETETKPFCLSIGNSSGHVKELSPREKWWAGMFVKLHKEMTEKGAASWLSSLSASLIVDRD